MLAYQHDFPRQNRNRSGVVDVRGVQLAVCASVWWVGWVAEGEQGYEACDRSCKEGWVLGLRVGELDLSCVSVGSRVVVICGKSGATLWEGFGGACEC
jgi:hypothetical protein